MTFRIDREGLITDKKLINEFCEFHDVPNDFIYYIIDNFGLYNWEKEYSIFFKNEEYSRLSKRVSNSKIAHILVLSRHIHYQDTRKLLFDFSIDISDYGKTYTTYDKFFAENCISDKNYISGFGDNESDISQLGFTNWEFVGFGKHRHYKNYIVAIEKAGHRIIAGIEGLSINGEKLDIQKLLELQSNFEFNNIWNKI